MQNNQEITANAIIEAILVISRPNQPKSTFKEAEEFLKKIERSNIVWLKSHEILSMDGLDSQVYFFAAKFLKQKLQFDFSQLTITDYGSILHNITGYMKKYKEENKAIRSTLVLSLIYFYMQTHEICGDLLDYLIANFQNTKENDPKIEKYILEVLEYVPDESENDDIVIDELKRTNYLFYMNNALLPKIFELLHQLGLKQDLETIVHYQIFKCFKNWLRLTEAKVILPNLKVHSVFNLALNYMGNPELNEKAADVINSVIGLIDNVSVQMELFSIIGQSIFSFFEKCEAAFREQNIDDASCYLRVFLKFGRHFMKDLINSQEDLVVHYFSYMIKATNHEDIEFEDLSNFWHKFCKALVEIQDPQLKEQRIIFFEAHLINLIHIICSRMNLSVRHFTFYNKEPDNGDQSEDEEDFERKSKERYELKETIKDIAELVGFESVLKVICQDLEAAFSRVQTKNSLQDWANIEGILYCVSSILEIDKIVASEELKKLLLLLITISISHVKLLNTIISIIGKSSAHISAFGTDLQSTLFVYLSRNLDDKRTFKLASRSIGDMCAGCKEFVISHFGDFLKLYDRLHSEDDVVKGLTEAICASKEESMFSEYLTALCKPFVEKLLLVLANANQPGFSLDDVNLELVSVNLDNLSLIIKTLPPVSPLETVPHVLAKIFGDLWSLLQMLLQRFDDVYEIVEKVIRCIKHTMRCIRQFFTPFLIPVFQLMITNYNKHPIPSYLYATEVAVTIFGKVPELIADLKNIYDFMCERTLQELSRLDCLEENPDLVEDFFGMLTRFTRYCPEITLASKSLNVALQLAEIGIGIQHKEAAKALYSYIEKTIRLCNPANPNFMTIHQELSNLIKEKYAKTYIKKLISSLREVPPSQVRDYIFDVFIEVLKSYGELSKPWFFESLIDVPADILVETEKVRFIEKFFSGDSNTQRDAFEHLTKRCKKSSYRNLADY